MVPPPSSSAVASIGDTYKDFAKGVKDFMRDLMASFPSVVEFKLMFAAYKVVKTFGKKHVYVAWCEAMGEKMEEVIKTRNDAYIVSKDFALPRSYWMYDSWIPVFQKLWLSIDAHSKDAIWRHLQYVQSLADRCRAVQSGSMSSSSSASGAQLGEQQ
jgi:hypothetical protein